MLSISIQKQLAGFALNVQWQSAARVVALVGPSGSGKTLTLQCLSGLTTPDEGRIVVNDRVLFDTAGGIDLPPQSRRVGYVFQGYALFPHMTVAQNVSYGVQTGSRSLRADRSADDVIERLGLTPLGLRYPAELSGGQQQRVALARALATDPDVLLLDEPLSALDLPLRRDLRSELSQTLREWGKTTVLVTHDLAEAYQVADVVVLYENGGTTDAAPKEDLLWKPASERVARLIGARNILRARVLSVDAQSVILDWRGLRVEAARSPSHAFEVAPGDELAFFVRPEYVRLIRKDRLMPDLQRHINLLHGEVTGERDEGTTWTLFFRLTTAGAPSQGDYDLEVEIPKLVYERLDIARDRRWRASIHPGSIQVLPNR